MIVTRGHVHVKANRINDFIRVTVKQFIVILVTYNKKVTNSFSMKTKSLLTVVLFFSMLSTTQFSLGPAA